MVVLVVVVVVMVAVVVMVFRWFDVSAVLWEL